MIRTRIIISMLVTMIAMLALPTSRVMAQYDPACAANCDSVKTKCQERSREVYVTCGQQGGTEAFCRDKQLAALNECLKAGGCEQCTSHSGQLLYYCKCGSPFDEQAGETEGYNGTMGCDVEVPPSCSDYVDNDGDIDIDYADSGCICPSPIVIDTAGNGFDFTSTAKGVRFDIAATGRPLQLSWIQNDDAWLALDRNGNGKVDNGTELFGNFTPQSESPKKSGFAALAEFDKRTNGGNEDGKITSADHIFSRLWLWRDANHNGISEPSELSRLTDLDVYEIGLDYKEARRTDPHGNTFRYHWRNIWDVFLAKQ